MRTFCRTLFIAAAGMAAAATGGAATAPSATAFLEGHDARVRAVVLALPSDSLSATDRDRVRALINEAFDFRELARLSLGEYWDVRSDEERNEFTRVLRGIIETRNFDTFIRYHREGRIRYTGEEVGADGRAVVHAQVPLKSETKQIAYYLHHPQGQSASTWQIYDLAIDGAATAEGNRRTYTRFIARHSYAELIERLRQQLAGLDSRG